MLSIETYIEADGKLCPNCCNDEVMIEPVNGGVVDGNRIVLRACLGCGFSWEEIYSPSGVLTALDYPAAAG